MALNAMDEDETISKLTFGLLHKIQGRQTRRQVHLLQGALREW